MIEILPENLANHVEKKCGSLAGQFFTQTPSSNITRLSTIITITISTTMSIFPALHYILLWRK